MSPHKSLRNPVPVATADAGTDAGTGAHAQREVVILVHGTGSGEVRSTTPRWWESTSEFATDLRARLGPLIEIGYTKDSEPFRWSGANSEAQRIQAGQQLLARLRRHDEDGIAYHLVGHSHGGSVIWHALQQAGGGKRGLKGLRSWTTIGTPFLEFRPIWIGVLMLIACLATGLLMLTPIGMLPHASLADGADELNRILRDPAAVPAVMLTALPWFALIVFFIAVLYYVAIWTFQMFQLPWRRRKQSAAAARYGGAWLGLWHADDEPIGGLRASLIQPVQFLPRMSNKPSGNIWGIVAAPIRFVIALIINRVVAPVVDEFVWVLSMGKLQGSDLLTRTMVHAGPAPGALAPGWPALPRDVDAEMTVRAGNRAADSVARMRHELAMLGDRAGGDEAVQKFTSSVTWSEILHNGYFDHAAVRELISAQVLSGSKIAERPETILSAELTGFLAAGHERTAPGRPEPVVEPTDVPRFVPWRLASVSMLGLGAVAAGLAGATFLAYGQLVERKTRDWQVNQLIDKATSREVMTGFAVNELVEFGTRLVVLERFSPEVLGRIIDRDTRTMMAQRLAYTTARARGLAIALREPLDKISGATHRAQAAAVAQALAGHMAGQSAAGSPTTRVNPVLPQPAMRVLSELDKARGEDDKTPLADEYKLAIWGMALPGLEALAADNAKLVRDLATAAAVRVASKATVAACERVRTFARAVSEPQPPALAAAVVSCETHRPSVQEPRVSTSTPPAGASLPAAPGTAPTVVAASASAAPATAPRAAPEPPERVRLRDLMKSRETHGQAADLISQHLAAVTATPNGWQKLTSTPAGLVTDAFRLRSVDAALSHRIFEHFSGPALIEIIKAPQRPNVLLPVADVFSLARSVGQLGGALNRRDDLLVASQRLAALSVDPAGLGRLYLASAAHLSRAAGNDKLAAAQIKDAVHNLTVAGRRFEIAIGLADLAMGFNVALTRESLLLAHRRVYDDAGTSIGFIANEEQRRQALATAIRRLRDIADRYLLINDIPEAQRSLELAADLVERPKHAPYAAQLKEYVSILSHVIKDSYRRLDIGLDKQREWPALVPVHQKPPG